MKSITSNIHAYHQIYMSRKDKEYVATVRMDKGLISINACHVCLTSSNALMSMFYYFNQYYGLHCTHGLSLGLNICSTLCLRGRE